MFDSTHPILPAPLQGLDLRRGMMQTVLGGRSAVDLPRLEVSDVGQAAAFLLRYGFDVKLEHHRELIHRNRSESLGFIRGILLNRMPLKAPDWLDDTPILELLLLAAVGLNDPNPAIAKRQAWACALLRVMHTFAHAENYFKYAYYPQIRDAILNRFVEQVTTNADGSVVLHGRHRDVPLKGFDVKEVKPVRSVGLKLLHTAENVATDLFDHIGVRITVDRPVDAIFAMRALLDTHTIMFANIKPTRSRNTLLDVDKLSDQIDQVAHQLRTGVLPADQVIQALANFQARPTSAAQTDWNPHSSNRYRSIQFTCRQMIRLPNPEWTRLERARRVAIEQLSGRSLEVMLETLNLAGVDREIQFFFPYEVQIMDQASRVEATQGRASYQEYKQRQVATVRQRVLGRVMRLEGLNPAIRPRRRRPTQSLKPLTELLRAQS